MLAHCPELIPDAEAVLCCAVCADAMKKAPKPAPAAAAVSSSSDAARPLPLLHQHALQSILAFSALRDVCARHAHLSRAWHSAAVSLPVMRAWRRMAQLSDTQLDDFAGALSELSTLRQANGAQKRKCIRNMRMRLRRDNCMAVASKLLRMFESSQITRKKIGIQSWRGLPGDMWIRFPLPKSEPAAASASTSASSVAVSAAASASFATIHVGFLVEEGGEHTKTDTYALSLDSDDRPKRNMFGRYGLGSEHILVEFSNTYDDHDSYDSTYRVAGLADWLRSIGVLYGSRRQQQSVLETVITTLLDMTHTAHGLRWDEPHSTACEKACKKETEQPELPEPALGPDEEERRNTGDR